LIDTDFETPLVELISDLNQEQHRFKIADPNICFGVCGRRAKLYLT
jgi:hypothetical protein